MKVKNILTALTFFIMTLSGRPTFAYQICNKKVEWINATHKDGGGHYSLTEMKTKYEKVGIACSACIDNQQRYLICNNPSYLGASWAVGPEASIRMNGNTPEKVFTEAEALEAE